MSVPDTNTFSLQDVVDEVNPSSDDLVECFADATPSGFDPAYEGSKDRLLNFRNYTHNNLVLDYNGSCDVQFCYEIDAVDASNVSLGMAMSGCAGGSSINFAYSGTKAVFPQTFKFRMLFDENNGTTKTKSIFVPVTTSSTFDTNFEWSFEISKIAYVDGTNYDSDFGYFQDNLDGGSLTDKIYVTLRFNRINSVAGTETCNLNGIDFVSI